jgi:hypothetical protein
VPARARPHHAERDRTRLKQAAHPVDQSEQTAAVAAQVYDDAGRVLQRAQRRAELVHHRRDEQVETYVAEAATQALRLELDKLRRERLEGRRQLTLQALARDEGAAQTVAPVEEREPHARPRRAVDVADQNLRRNLVARRRLVDRRQPQRPHD